MQKGWFHLIITIIRTIIMYIFVVATLRMMGKRQIGELEASELVVTIIISEIAAMPITNIEFPLSSSIIAMLILMILEVLISFSAFKNPRVRGVLYGKPSVFYENGKLNQDEMLKQRFNVADIMEEVRGNGVCSLSDVEFIVMETNGNVSVILKSEKSPVTPECLNIKTKRPRMSYIIIDNGILIYDCLKRLGLDDIWLNKQLKSYHLKNVNQVFYMSYEQETGETVLIPKNTHKRKKM